MTVTKTPVKFTCQCGTEWLVPPETHCPSCGPDLQVISTPDDCVWEVSEVLPELYLTAMLRDQTRFYEIIFKQNPRNIVDLAGEYDYVWRPYPSDFAHLGMAHHRIDGVVDTQTKGFDPHDLSLFRNAMDVTYGMGESTLVHCAAGLRRGPHFVYAWLRTQGHDPVEAWDLVEKARPFVFMHTPYIDSIEAWLETL